MVNLIVMHTRHVTLSLQGLVKGLSLLASAGLIQGVVVLLRHHGG
jgi:hypothetical protein